MEKEEEPKEHRESMLYRIFWPQAHGEAATHASHPLSTCPTCEDDVHKCECMENDSLGG